MKTIEFIQADVVDERYFPRPAKDCLPAWYKETNPGTNDIADGARAYSIRGCMPTYDAMTAGYIIPTPADYWVTQEYDHRAQGGKCPVFHTRNFAQPIVEQPGEHAPNHPLKANNVDFPKFASPWIIKTPPGYSTMFIDPLGETNEIFRSLPAVIDTDVFYHRIAFPFVLRDPNFSGLIPAGTPMVQAIPFKREEWQMEISKPDIESLNRSMVRLASKLFSSYKVHFWNKKSFK